MKYSDKNQHHLGQAVFVILFFLNVIVVFLIYTIQRNQIIEIADNTQTTVVESNQTKVKEITLSVISDLYLLQSELERDEYLTSESPDLIEPEKATLFEDSMTSWLDANPQYSHIQLISKSGRDILHIHKGDMSAYLETNVNHNLIHPDFESIQNLDANDIYLSRLDYQQEQGELLSVNGNPVPTIRFISPITDSSGIIAYLSINMDMAVFLNTLYEELPSEASLTLLDSNGYYILTSDPTKEQYLFGFLYSDDRNQIYQPNDNLYHLMEDAKSEPNIIHYPNKTVLIVKLNLDNVRQDLSENYNISPNLIAENNEYYLEATIDLSKIGAISNIMYFFIFAAVLGGGIDLAISILIVRLMKERKERLMQVAYDASHDYLTDTCNRNELANRSQKLFEAKIPFIVLFIDFDGFKNTNDTHGHQIGDQLLIQGAKRMKSCIREEDTIARFGGDEFIILLPNTMDSNVGTRIKKELEERFQEPIILGELEFTQTISIGLSYSNEFKNMDELLSTADEAMYAAKKQKEN